MLAGMMNASNQYQKAQVMKFLAWDLEKLPIDRPHKVLGKAQGFGSQTLSLEAECLT